MVSAWIHDNKDSIDCRELHQTNPVQSISLTYLEKIGVSYWKLSTEGAVANPEAGKLGEIRKQRNYSAHDVVTISREKLPNYDEKLKIFYAEHLHEDEEIRFIIEGSGFFDMRDEIAPNHPWIRIHVEQGDMIVLPAGCYHRFTMDTNNYTVAMRLFKENPKWEAINRGEKADCTKARAEYVDFCKKVTSTVNEQENKVGTNGEAFIMKEGNAAKSIANYPHMRSYNGLLYVSGISSRRPDNTHEGATKLADGSWELDIAIQTRSVLNNIKKILNCAGADLNHAIQNTVFLTDMKYYTEYNKVYNEFFPVPELAPTRTTVAVHQLPHPNLLIEIQTIAADPRANKH